MTTAHDICKDALVLLGVVNPEDPLTDADAETALGVLNHMMDEWASENLYTFQLNNVSVAVTAGNGTFGVAGVRPWAVLTGLGTANIIVGGVTTPVDVVSEIEFQALAGYTSTPGTPDTMAYTRDYPAGTIQLLPVPNANGSLNIVAWNRLVSFVNLDTAYVLPPGEQDLLRDNLAVQLKNFFSDSQLSPVVVARAAEEKMFFVYHGIVSRAMQGRFVVSAPKAPAQ